MHNDKEKVLLRRRSDEEEWKIDFDSPEQADKVISIIETLQGGKKGNLTTKVKETLATEPIKATFAVIGSAVVAFLLWYLGLKP